MNVYVVTQYHGGNEETIEKVFSTYEKAQTYITQQGPESCNFYMYIHTLD